MEHISGIVQSVIAKLEKDAGDETPSPKKRPLTEILDEIESRISPDVRNLTVRDGEIVEK